MKNNTRRRDGTNKPYKIAPQEGALLAWVDVETTGLSDTAQTGHLLEVALAVTRGPELELVDVNSWVLQIPDEALECMDPFVLDMHTKNGLLGECYGKDAWPLKFAERDCIKWLQDHNATKSAMCGSSIHTDREWLRHQMPDLAATFHYRQVDASSLMILAQMHGAVLPPAERPHRAMADVLNSIELARNAWGYGVGWEAIELHCRALRALLPDCENRDGIRQSIDHIEHAVNLYGRGT
jgi:oligoribonuclease